MMIKKLQEKYDALLNSIPSSTKKALSYILAKQLNVDIQATDFSKFEVLKNPRNLSRDPRLKDPNFVVLYLVKLISGNYQGKEISRQNPKYRLFFAEHNGKPLNYSTKYSKKIYDIAFDDLYENEIIENFAGEEIAVKDLPKKKVYDSFISSDNMARRNILRLTYRVYLLDLTKVDSNAAIKAARRNAQAGSLLTTRSNLKFNTSNNKWEYPYYDSKFMDKSGFISGGQRLKSLINELRQAKFDANIGGSLDKAINLIESKINQLKTAIQNSALNAAEKIAVEARVMKKFEDLLWDVERYNENLKFYQEYKNSPDVDLKILEYYEKKVKRSLASLKKYVDFANRMIIEISKAKSIDDFNYKLYF